MASNIAKITLLRLSATRSTSCLPCGIPVGGTKTYDIITTTLSSKLVVASANNQSQIARVGLFFRAGSRYETPSNLGLTHVLRIAAGSSTRDASHFAIKRNLQEVGSTLICTADREVISYTLESTQDGLERSLPYLATVATQDCFKPWEVSDNIPRIRLELATRRPEGLVIDLLHKAAFRRQGLGNSIYISNAHLGGISSENLQHYVLCNYTSNRAALVGLGVNDCILNEFAECLTFNSSEEAPLETVYTGSEIRQDQGGAMTYIAVAGEGGCLIDAKEALAFAILQRAFGTGPSIKRAKQNQGLLAPVMARSDEPITAVTLNISYIETGLFGVLMSAPAKTAGTVLQNVLTILKQGSVPDEDVERAKKQLQSAILFALENGNISIDDIGNQAVLLGTVANACQLVKAIDIITPEDVNNAAKKVATSRLSLAALGDLSSVPYLDELT